MIVNANLIVQHVVPIKNGIMTNVNMSEVTATGFEPTTT